MNKWSKRPLSYMAAIALGALLTLAFAPYNLSPLAIIAPAGLFALWFNATVKRAFWLGFCFGIGLFSTGVYWIFISIHVSGDVPSSFAGLITALLILILALFPATVGYMIKRFFPAPSSVNLIFAFPAVWILISEWFRSQVFCGFPWLFIGYSQIDSPLKGFAPILGVYGVSLVALLTSALLFNSWLQYKQKNYHSLYVSLLAITVIWITGSLLNLITWTSPSGKSLSVSLVQADIPQSVKWDPNHLQLSFDRYVELTEPLWGKTDLVIWPEAAIPLTMQNAEGFIDALDERAQKTNTQLILGIPVEAVNGKQYHNAIIALGKERGFYFKRLLVPFGEYVPLERFFSGVLNFLNVPISNLVPGNAEQKPLHVSGVKILPSICFEITFPDLMRSQDQSIDLLLTVTNDAWFGKSSAQAQHLQMAQMRALEFNRPVLFASNDGITAIIASNGTIAATAPDHEMAVLKGTVQPMNGLTPWMYFGSDATLFMLVCMLYVAIRTKRNALKTVKLSTNAHEQSQGLANS